MRTKVKMPKLRTTMNGMKLLKQAAAKVPNNHGNAKIIKSHNKN
jgi:hypothetical protein